MELPLRPVTSRFRDGCAIGPPVAERNERRIRVRCVRVNSLEALRA
jgi:hypothetical protein